MTKATRITGSPIKQLKVITAKSSWLSSDLFGLSFCKVNGSKKVIPAKTNVFVNHSYQTMQVIFLNYRDSSFLNCWPGLLFSLSSPCSMISYLLSRSAIER